MDQDKQKHAEAASVEPEVKVDTPLAEADLDIVTGGLISGGGSLADDGSCITSAP